MKYLICYYFRCLFCQAATAHCEADWLFTCVIQVLLRLTWDLL